MSYTTEQQIQALILAADEWDDSIRRGLHEVGVPVSAILRRLAKTISQSRDVVEEEIAEGLERSAYDDAMDKHL